MAASTLTRSGVTLTNDTGTAASPAGDGTLLNDAWVQTFMDRIDSMFSGNLTLGALLTVEGFGNHQFVASGTGNQLITLRNTAAGTANLAALLLGNDQAASRGQFRIHASNYTTSNAYIADGYTAECSGAGGIQILANNAAGDIGFWTGGASRRGRFTATGHLILTELTANPTTDDLAADAALAIYTKADKLVFAYNNGGTLTFITLDLDGSDTSLTHGTSAP